MVIAQIFSFLCLPCFWKRTQEKFSLRFLRKHVICETSYLKVLLNSHDDIDIIFGKHHSFATSRKVLCDTARSVSMKDIIPCLSIIASSFWKIHTIRPTCVHDKYLQIWGEVAHQPEIKIVIPYCFSNIS